jgi:hypothetical protein
MSVRLLAALASAAAVVGLPTALGAQWAVGALVRWNVAGAVYMTRTLPIG